MSGGPLTDQRSNEVLPGQATPSAPTPRLSVDNVKPWSPSSIASSIIDTLTRSYMWSPRGENQNKGIHGDEGDMRSKRVESMNMLRDTHSTDNVGGIEYTSEHLEKALIELKSSGIIDVDFKPAVVVASRTMIQVEQKNASSETINIKSDMEITTVVAYPVNIKQSNRQIGVKPEVTDISTQSTMDRVRLSTQTTTDDLPEIPSPPKTISNAETSPETEMDSERPSKKSKVPILKPGHSLSSSSTSIQNKALKCNSNQKLPNSKIPLKTSTSSKESISIKPGLRVKNEKICRLSTRKHIKTQATQENIKIQNELTNFIRENNLKPNDTKEGTPILLQTDELSPCGEPNKEERLACSHEDIDEMRKHLLDNIQKVENVLSSLPRDDLGKLYGEYVLGRHASTMTDDLQVAAFAQCEDKEDDVNRKLYEAQVYKDERLVSLIDIDSTTCDVKPMDEGENEVDDDDEYEDLEEEPSEENIPLDSVVSRESLKVTQSALRRIKPEQNSLKDSRTCLIECSASVKERKMSIVDTSSAPIKEEVEVEKRVETKTDEKKEEKAKEEVVKPTQVLLPKPKEEVVVKERPKEESRRNEDIRKVTKEEIAYEVNVFNMIQSQKINNILRLAMPYNNILLPVFVSAPSAIMLSLEKELRHTMEIKRQASVYFNGLIARSSKSKPCQRVLEKKSAINNGVNKRSVVERKKQLVKVPSCASYGSVIGPTIVAQHQATWAKPPFYYGSYKKIAAK